MAIKAGFNKNGFFFDNAYFKINRIEGGKENGLTGYFGVYYNKSARDSSGEPVYSIDLKISWDGTGNPYNLLYAALKLVYTDGTDI